MIKKSYIALGLALSVISFPISALLELTYAEKEYNKISQNLNNGVYKTLTEKDRILAKTERRLNEQNNYTEILAYEVNQRNPKHYPIIHYNHSALKDFDSYVEKFMLEKQKADELQEQYNKKRSEPTKEVAAALLVYFEKLKNNQ